MRFLGGLVLLAAGAWLDFWPLGSTTAGAPATVSFWQAHDLCTSGIGELGQVLSSNVATSCSTVTVIWLAGIGLILVGALVALSALLRPGVPRPMDTAGPSWPAPPSPVAKPPAPVDEVPPAPDPMDPHLSGEHSALRVRTEDATAGATRDRARRPGRRVIVAASAVLVVLVGAWALTSWGPLAGPATVPVVACATTYGGYPPAPASLPPTTVEPFLAPGAASGLTEYASADGRFTQLAPRGWICSASIGADGSWGLTIHPLADPSATVETDGAFNGPGIDTAAPLFPAAHQACLQQFAGMDTTTTCPSPPPEEVIDPRSASLVYFSEPPGLQNGSVGLSGAYTVLGAMTFAPPSSETEVACAMPDSSRAVCQDIVDATTRSWAGQK